MQAELFSSHTHGTKILFPCSILQYEILIKKYKRCRHIHADQKMHIKSFHTNTNQIFLKSHRIFVSLTAHYVITDDQSLRVPASKLWYFLSALKGGGRTICFQNLITKSGYQIITATEKSFNLFLRSYSISEEVKQLVLLKSYPRQYMLYAFGQSSESI